MTFSYEINYFYSLSVGKGIDNLRSNTDKHILLHFKFNIDYRQYNIIVETKTINCDTIIIKNSSYEI